MKNKKKICVFTGGRAEYGILKPLLSEIKNSKKLYLQMLVSGMHLSNEFGLTYKIIEKDGFKCDEKVEMVMSSDTTEGVCKSIGLGIIGYGEALKRLSPDWLVILGDRYESLALAVAATVSRVPIIHIQGGEITVGAIDDHFRHSITKMSNIHFVYADEYRKRVIQLGENPSTVFNYGALNLDAIRKAKLLSQNNIFKELNLDKAKQVALVTFHPVTLENNSSSKQFKELLRSLKKFNSLQLVFTKTNSDTDGRVINLLIDEYVSNNIKNATSSKSLGQTKYISLLKYCSIVIGNSSSGIIETPLFKIPTVNIGDREKGRIRTKNIIDCSPTNTSITKAIKKGLSKNFIKSLIKMSNPLDKKNTSKNIVKKMENFPKISSTKKFFYEI